jgi:hypothetical protein
MTLEALILHMLDDLDAKAHTFRGLIAGGTDERWSAYHRLLGHFVFKGFSEERASGEIEEVPPKTEKDKDHPTLF